MKEEPRYMQKQYEKQNDTTNYDQNREKQTELRHDTELAQTIQKRTLKGGSGNGRNPRRQTGVTVINGDPNLVRSTTRADGVRPRNYPSGVVWINEEASKIDKAPISFVPENEEEEQQLFEKPLSETDTGGEM
jgi:hypothetical protein